MPVRVISVKEHWRSRPHKRYPGQMKRRKRRKKLHYFIP